MKAALTTCKDDIFPPEAANNDGLQHTARSSEFAPSCPNLNLGASRTPHDYVMSLSYCRMLKSVRGLTPTVVKLSARV